MYTTIQEQSWSDLLASLHRPWQPPVTVHLPIQPVHSPDLVHVDCALNVCRRKIWPGLSVLERNEAAENRETFQVQLAPGDPPFVPDYRYSRLSLSAGRYPLAHAEYYTSGRDMLYAFDYCCLPLDDRQSLLWISGRVTNESPATRQAHVHAKVNVQREADLFDYHYVPFGWDASRWLPCTRVALEGNRILFDGAETGRVVAGDFSCAWVDEKTIDQSAYGSSTPCDGFHIMPAMRFATIRDAMHFTAELPPGESRAFHLALLVNYEEITPAHRQALATARAPVVQAEALAHFQAQLTPELASLTFPTGRWEELFTALQLSTLQLCIRFPDQPWLVPTQGGSTERDYIWVWEAVAMLHPLLSLGHFAPVRQALDYIFSLQDSGSPPVGRFTSIAGAIGTTGPRWMNTTGAALTLAADYYRFARDAAFLENYLEKILRAADWIVGEIRATRVLEPDGSRPTTYGLMPFGCATDGDVGYTIAFSDAYNFQGLEKSALLLESLNHPRARELRAEVERYREDIHAAVTRLARPDGYIERKVLTGDAEEEVFTTAEYVCGAQHLVYAGALDAGCALFARFIDFFETHAANDMFLGSMDRDITYVGTSELIWQEIYLRRGEWKKAFLAAWANLHYGMTQDTFQVQERFSRSNPCFTPWQPNGSGNGRMLRLLLNALYFPDGQGATLFGGIPFAWLRWNAVTVLSNLHTPTGRLTLNAVMLDAARCRVTLIADRPAAMPTTLRLPDHFTVEETAARAGDQANTFTVGEGETEISFIICG